MNSAWMPQIDKKRCTGCTQCISQCPTGALGQSEGKAALLHPNLCTYCSLCEDICPAAAIELPFLIIRQDHQEETIS